MMILGGEPLTGSLPCAIIKKNPREGENEQMENSDDSCPDFEILNVCCMPLPVLRE